MRHFPLKSLVAWILLSGFLWAAQVPARAVNYEADTSDFANPERGFFHQWLSDSRSPSPLASWQFTALKQDKMTLVRRLYSMTTFRSGAISSAFLQHIQNDMDSVRSNGAKVILRFAYTFNEAAPNDDAPLATVLSHLDQLAPVLRDNADVIAYMEAGFIGRWGEWHTSSNGLDNTSDMRTVLYKILSVLPASRCVAVRTQTYKKAIFNYSLPLTPAEGFSGTDRARTAHHNDCFCADKGDMGTYPWPYADSVLAVQKDYLNAENRFLPQGGETCQLNPPWSDCAHALEEVVRMRWSALNEDYNRDVLDGWKSQGCYPDIRKKIGYRFRLVRANLPDTAYAGDTLSFGLVVRNDGYAAPYNARRLELVMRARSGGAVTRFPLKDNPRSWLPENGETSVDAGVGIPPGFALGGYDMLLNLPDSVPALSLRPGYSIRLANRNTWEPGTGYNSLLHSVTIAAGSGVDAAGRASPCPALECAASGGTLHVRYFLRTPAGVRLAVYGITGKPVAALANGPKAAGEHSAAWDFKGMPSGVYLVRLTAGDVSVVRKAMVVQ